jgi:hypothetical protein
MVTIRTLLNALNLYLALHYNETPMRLKEFFTALNPQDRRPLRFYFVTLWAYVSTAATLVCILLPVLTHYLNVVNTRVSNTVSLMLAIGMELIWLIYALTVLSWRVSGYLYKNAAAALQWTNARVRAVGLAHFPKLFYREGS